MTFHLVRLQWLKHFLAFFVQNYKYFNKIRGVGARLDYSSCSSVNYEQKSQGSLVENVCPTSKRFECYNCGLPLTGWYFTWAPKVRLCVFKNLIFRNGDLKNPLYHNAFRFWISHGENSVFKMGKNNCF